MRIALNLMAGLALALALAACNKPAGGVGNEDMSLGSAKAKVTMIEYASVSCPHCARWNNDVFPTIKTKYIDTGRVHYVLREALTGDPQIAAAGFLTARCAGKDKYFQVVDAVYHSLEQMAAGSPPRPILQQIAKSAGLSEAQFDKCVTDEKALKALNDRWEGYMRDEKISGTPTFIINGKRYDKGEMPLAEMEAAIAEAEKGNAGVVSPPRRALLLAALALGLTAGAARAADPGMALGSPKAKVTVVEFASVGCPHCGAWAREVYPAFKQRYIDTGKVRFVFREVITGDAGLAVAGFVTARCAAPGKYFQVVDAIFANQQSFYEGGAYAKLLAVAQAAGLTEDQFKACLDDPAAKAAVDARSAEAAAEGVDSTPTFLVNGVKVEDHSLEALAAAVERASRSKSRR